MPRRSKRPSKFHLLVDPRETLPVLEHISKHPDSRPTAAARDLGIAVRTWYEAVDRLDRMGLVTQQVGRRDARTRRHVVTPRGEAFLKHLKAALEQAENTPALFDYELVHDPPRKGSARAGEILCHLIQDAEQRGDFGRLRDLEGAAAALGRPAEKWLAIQVAAFLQGRQPEAKRSAEKALALMGRSGNSPSLRKALYLYASTLDYVGDSKGSYEQYTRLRKLARDAKDHAVESDAWLGLGILKARAGQLADGAKFMERALRVAVASGNDAKRAKVLANLAFLEMVLGRATALDTADQALALARKVGSRIIVGRAQLNRAMLLAAEGSRDGSLEALREARKIMGPGGEERGQAALDEWSALVRRILRPRHSPYPEDWRAQALRLAMKRPSQSPEGRPALLSGPTRSE